MFFLFGWNDYSASTGEVAMGGMADFQGSFQSLEEAIEKASRNELEWWHVVDVDSLKIVAARCEINWVEKIQERIDGVA